MENFFESIFNSSSITVGTYFAMIGTALATGLLYSLLLSLVMHSSKKYFIANAIMPAIIAIIIAFVNGNIGAGLAIAGAFGFIRFRSAQGSADEIGMMFVTCAAGFAFGMGYLAYGAIFTLIIALAYIALTFLPVWNLSHKGEEKMLTITIPEDLNYDEVLTPALKHYARTYSLLKVKTTNMGSLYKLSYLIKLKNYKEEKEFIDNLRELNGNLEVMMQSYALIDQSGL